MKEYETNDEWYFPHEGGIDIALVHIQDGMYPHRTTDESDLIKSVRGNL